MASKVPSLLLTAFLSLHSFLALEDIQTTRVDLYVNTHCAFCPIPWSADELIRALSEIGITRVQVRDVGEPTYFKLNELRKKLGVPGSWNAEVAVSIDEKFLFLGYVSIDIITDFLTNHTQEYETIVVFRNSPYDPYMILDCEGHIKVGRMEGSTESLVEDFSLGTQPTSLNLVFVIASGILDGINPCAFAVLLFFTAILFVRGTDGTPKEARKKVLSMCLPYIAAVFLAYMMIGLAIIQTIRLTPFSHLVAKMGAMIMVLIGLVNIKDHFWPGKGISFGIPRSQWDTVRRWMHKLNVPSAFILGLTVGFFEFPCTGGIYAAILGLLAVKTTFAQGFAYLLVYNLAFILPLMAVLAIALKKEIRDFSLVRWQQHEQKSMKLVSGLIMVVLGILLILAGFV